MDWTLISNICGLVGTILLANSIWVSRFPNRESRERAMEYGKQGFDTPTTVVRRPGFFWSGISLICLAFLVPILRQLGILGSPISVVSSNASTAPYFAVLMGLLAGLGGLPLLELVHRRVYASVPDENGKTPPTLMPNLRLQGAIERILYFCFFLFGFPEVLLIWFPIKLAGAWKRKDVAGYWTASIILNSMNVAIPLLCWLVVRVVFPLYSFPSLHL